MDNLRDLVHKWRDGRQQKMIERLGINSKNIKSHESSAILGVKPSTSSTISSAQKNKEKTLPKKPLMEIRQTKTSARRQLLANPLLEPKNVQFVEEMQRRQTLCVEKSQKNDSKITFRETDKKQTLKLMGQYDLNGRRLTVSTNDLSNLSCTEQVLTGIETGAISKCKKSEMKKNTNDKRNNLTLNKYSTKSVAKCNGSAERGSTSKIDAVQQHRRSQSCSSIRSKCPQLYNNELTEFEQQYCKTDIEESLVSNKTNTSANTKRETMTLSKGNLPSSNVVQESRRMTFLKKNSDNHKTSVSKGLPRQPNCRLTMTLNEKKVSSVHNRTSASVNRAKVDKKSSMRRSLSQEDLQRKKTVSIRRRSSSTEDLNKLRKQVRFVSPIIEETSSLLLADSSLSGSRHSGRPSISTPCNFSSNLQSKDKKRKLLNWLSEKGIPLNSYRHLQCFSSPGSNSSLVVKTKELKRNKYQPQIPEEEEACGNTVDVSFDDENKENICSTSASENELDESQLMKVTCGALKDLRALLVAGYDHHECESWMESLKKRCPKICDFVEYWECLASLDEAKGDYNMAVDSYQRAIVRGAEVDNINQQLDSLLSKMNDLKLETPQKDKTSSPRNIDIKNIFKSKVIQFALQQKAVKRLGDLGVNTQTLYIATPVRRSTRKSMYDPKCLRSLDDLDPEKRGLTEFQPNPALK